MKIKVTEKLRRPTFIFKAASLSSAYKKGMFSGSMSRYEMMDRLTKYNSGLRWYANKTHMGLFDSEKSKFICGITHCMTIPKHSISRWDTGLERALPGLDEDGKIKNQYIMQDDKEGYILARGWLPTLQIVEGKKYNINWEGLTK